MRPPSPKNKSKHLRELCTENNLGCLIHREKGQRFSLLFICIRSCFRLRRGAGSFLFSHRKEKLPRLPLAVTLAIFSPSVLSHPYSPLSHSGKRVISKSNFPKPHLFSTGSLISWETIAQDKLPSAAKPRKAGQMFYVGPPEEKSFYTGKRIKPNKNRATMIIGW